MKYNSREITEFSDNELIQTHNYFTDILSNRTEAAKNKKFDKQTGMEFPQPNPEFLKIHTAIKKEIAERKLTVWK